MSKATEFLSKFGLSLSVDFGGFECPPWDDDKHIHGDRWDVVIRRGARDFLTFPFWNSHADANGWRQERWAGTSIMEDAKALAWKKNHPPSAYDVLSCISSDINGETDPDEVYKEFGEMLPSRAKAIADFNVKLQLYFTTEEQEALAEIQ